MCPCIWYCSLFEEWENVGCTCGKDILRPCCIPRIPFMCSLTLFGWPIVFCICLIVFLQFCKPVCNCWLTVAFILCVCMCNATVLSPPHAGKTTISNDGATIMKLLDVVHPAAKTLVDISLSQDAEVGGWVREWGNDWQLRSIFCTSHIIVALQTKPSKHGLLWLSRFIFFMLGTKRI